MGTVRRARVLSLILANGLLACSSQESLPDEVVFTAETRMGVEYVTNSGDDRMLELIEVLSVGVMAEDPDHQFFGVRSVGVDSTGGFWVVDGGPTVRQYDAEGQYVGSVGGRGSGPGESSSYLSVSTGPGTVLVVGLSPRALHLFRPDGTLLESRSIPPRTGGSMTALGYSEQQWVFVSPELNAEVSREHGEIFRFPLEVSTAQDVAGDPALIASFPGESWQGIGFPGEGPVRRASFLSGWTSFGIDGSGRLFASDTVHYRVETLDFDGSLRRVVERVVPPRLVEPSLRREIEEAVRSTVGGTVDDAWIERWMTGVIPTPAPEVYPSIERLLVAHDGSFWVERADRHPAPVARALPFLDGTPWYRWPAEWFSSQVFDRFSASGEYRGTVTFPRNYVPLAVTSSHVYGVRRGELDVEAIVLYEVPDE